MKVFVSYSRDDVAFADQLVIGLESLGFDPILDRHDIDAAENWRERLGKLILSADAVAFVLTERSATSPICGWEVEEARRLGKRIVPVVPREVSATPPQALADLNWIYFYATAAMPGSGMFDGLRKLERALRLDLAWLREQTRLSERAEEWRREPAEDRLLRGQALKEAHAWLGRAPKNASVPASVRDYLTASADAEQGREAATKAQLAEREEALKQAQTALASEQTAVKERAKAERRLRWFGIGSLAAGLVLIGGALAVGYLAVQNYADAGNLRAQQFTAPAGQLSDEANHAAALMTALTGDPAAQGGFIDHTFFPTGRPAVRAALERAFTLNRLERVVVDDASTASGVTFSADGRQILTQAPGENPVVDLRSAADGKVLQTFRLEGGEAVSAWLLPGGKEVALTDKNGGVHLWRIGEAAPYRTVAVPVDAASGVPATPIPIGMALDGRFLVAGALSITQQGYDFREYAFPMEDGATAPPKPFYTAQGPFAYFSAEVVTQALPKFAISPDGRMFAVGGSKVVLFAFDPEGGIRKILEFKGFERVGEKSGSLLAFSPDSKLLIESTINGQLGLWDVETGRRPTPVSGPGRAPLCNPRRFRPTAK